MAFPSHDNLSVSEIHEPYNEEDDSDENNRPVDFEIAKQLLDDTYIRFSKDSYYRTKDGVKAKISNDISSLVIVPMMTLLNIKRLEKRIDELEEQLKVSSDKK